MRLFRRKKKRLSITQVPLTVLMREIIYDAMLTPTEGIAELIGLPPISSEVAEMEEQASQDRLSNISGLIPFIDAHADIAAKIATSAYMLDEDNNEDMTPEQVAKAADKIKAFRGIGTYSTFTHVDIRKSLWKAKWRK